MHQLPFYVSALFTAVSLLAILLFYRATVWHKPTLIVLLTWMLLQAMLAFFGFFEVTDTMPPRVALLAGPPILVIILLFATRKGASYLDKIDVSILPLLHTLRIVVEFVLFQLFV